MAKDERDPPEDIPPIHVLEAMHEKDKKETEELISGFDRPGRTPRKAPSRRDFVDYYAKKEPSARMAPPPSKRTEERATVVVSRKRDLRTVMVWAGAVAGMVLFGAVVAILATPDAPQPNATPTMMVPSSATTITSGSAAPIETAPARDDSETTTPTVIVATPPAPAKTAKTAPVTTAGSSASTGAATTIKTAPRDDFIRDL